MIDNEKLNQFFEDLFNERIRIDSSHGGYTTNVIEKSARCLVKEKFIKFLNDNHDHNTGQMQAKVRFYEEMIAKSNFKPFLIQEEDDN